MIIIMIIIIIPVVLFVYKNSQQHILSQNYSL